MDAVIHFVASGAGVLIGIAWIVGVISVVGVFVFRHRRRAIMRGTYPVRLLPWYLGGTPEMRTDHPPERLTKRRFR